MSVQRENELPVNFRAEVVETILCYLAAGDSCAVVGIGSVGKSNLLRFLQRKDVLRAYSKDKRAAWLFVYVDANKTLHRSLWGLVELMLHQLLVELTRRKARKAVLRAVDELHQRTADPKTRYLALRYLDRALGLVCDRLGWRLVFLIDEFDDLCVSLSPRGLAALRALRDDHKYRLMYVVATRLELSRLRENASEIEAFEELVSPHTVWLGPYTERDARFMLRRLGARHGIQLDGQVVESVLSQTGGHPGLLREAYHVARSSPQDLAEALANEARVQAECQRIWFSLTAGEQQAMTELASGVAVQPQRGQMMEGLRHKGLLRGPSGAAGQILVPLLADYIRQHHPVVGVRIYVDPERRSVWVNGREIKGLPPLEYELMAYLVERRGQVCSRDELARHLYPHDMTLEGDGVADSRIDSVVKRLRKQVEPNPGQPRYVVTVRGHGLCLADGDEAGRLQNV